MSDNKPIYYQGSELQWSTFDVFKRADDLGIELTEGQALSILISTFQDNEYIMEMIGDELSETLAQRIKNAKL